MSAQELGQVSKTVVVIFAIILIPFGKARAGADGLWDPPAIDVFPNHEAAARSPKKLAQLLRDGRRLFETKFNAADGAGRSTATGDSKPTFRLPENNVGFIRTSGPDANSCAGCHNQPVVGGSGEFAVNVFVGAQFRDPPTRSIHPDQTNERNTIGLFGAGAIEMLAREMTAELLRQRSVALGSARRLGRNYEVELNAKGVKFGSIVGRPDGTFDASKLEGVDPDLVIKPFSFKGVVISIREFTINALNHHHGIQAVERFGWERTGMRDFDGDGVEIEFTIGQVSALTLFQASLPAPVRAPVKRVKQRQTILRGEELFARVGCASCHVPALRLEAREFVEPSPYDRPGNLLPEDVERQIRIPLKVSRAGRGGIRRAPDGSLVVLAYTDLKRHRICDEEEPFFCNERLKQDNLPTDQFLTAKLWDLATSAPYGHRGDCVTLSEAIIHHGGEARMAREAFLALPDEDKRNIVAFLRNLGSSRASYQVPH